MSAAVVGVNKHLPMKKIMMHLWQKNRTHLKYQSYYIYVLRDVNRSSSYVLQKLKNPKYPGSNALLCVQQF